MTWHFVPGAVWGLSVMLAGGLLTDVGPWYAGLHKPSWQPPNWAFAPAWTVILGLASYALLLGLASNPTATGTAILITLYLVNGALNVLWSALFFRCRRPDWALTEVPFLWLSIAALIVALWPLSHAAGLMLVPYIAWVSFATVLNHAIVRRNAPLAAAAGST